MINILVEGETDVAFIKYICQYLSIDSTIIKITDMNGIGGLNKTIESLSPELQRGEKILIFADADNSYQTRKDEITNIINNKSIDFFLLPNNEDKGDLESLLLSTLPNNIILKCFDTYIECLKQDNINITSINDKSRLFAYTTLSFNQKPKESFENFDFNHQSFYKIKEFLNSVCI